MFDKIIMADCNLRTNQQPEYAGERALLQNQELIHRMHSDHSANVCPSKLLIQGKPSITTTEVEDRVGDGQFSFLEPVLSR